MTSRWCRVRLLRGDRLPDHGRRAGEYLQSPHSHPTREEVESGTIRLAAFNPYQKDESHATLMYARAAGLTLVHTYLLGFGIG